MFQWNELFIYCCPYLHLATKFGAMLDQLTDRAATMGLLLMLGIFYPSYAFWFQMSACLDIVSHWLHLHR